VSEIYHFDWGRDKAGYEIQLAGGTGRTALEKVVRERIVGLGGPIEYYRPLEDHPALWRRFADTCGTRERIIPFVNEFGPPDGRADDVAYTIQLAQSLQRIAYHFERGERAEACDAFNECNPLIRAKIFPSKKGGLLKLVPDTLAGAMIIQAGEALTGNHQFRKCRNCPEWFRLGAGENSSRREFCCDRCRVAFNRRRKRESTA
jgi:hypothetical protein